MLPRRNVPKSHSKRILLAALALLSLLAAAGVAADRGADPASGAQVVAPVIDETTVAVVRVDASRLDPEAVLGKLAALAPELGRAANEVLEAAKKTQAAFTQAGGRDLYVVVGLTDLFTEPWFLVVPLAEGADANALSEVLGSACEAHQRIDGVLVGGRKGTLERLAKLQPDPRPELETAFAAAGEAAIQALLLPPKHSSRVIEEMMPALPKEIGGGPSRTLTLGLRWAALSVDAVPQASVRLVIQSQDAPAAHAMRDKWLTTLTLLSTKEAVLREFPPLPAAAEILKPDVQQDRLVLTFDEQNGRLAKLLDAIRATIRQDGKKPAERQP